MSNMRSESMGLLESDTTERLHFSLSCIGEGNGNPLQCSCLENPRDGGAWWAAVCGVTQSPTRLKRQQQQQQQRLPEPVKCSTTPVSSWTSDHSHVDVQSPQGAPSCLSGPLAMPTHSFTVPAEALRCSNKLEVIFCFTSSRWFLRQK